MTLTDVPTPLAAAAWATATSPSGADPPPTKPISASMSSRRDGPKLGVPPSSGRSPLGRGTSVPDGTTVPARPW